MVLSGLTVYKVEVEFLSPALVIERVGKRGYTSLRDRLPGQTIRGALLTALWRLGIELEELPSLQVSVDTALPIDISKKGFFGHPFTAIPKVAPIGDERYALSFLGPTWLAALTRACREALSLHRLMGDACIQHARKIMKIGGEIASTLALPLLERGLGRALVEIEKPGLYIEAGYPTHLEISTAISHARGASEAGMIYAYEALPVGARFTTRLVDINGILTDLMREQGLLKGGRLELSVRIGRGSSRGFGHAILRATVEDGALKDVISRAQLALEAGGVPLVTSSPLTTLEADGRGIISRAWPPKTLEVPNQWHQNAALEARGSLKLTLVDLMGLEKAVRSYSLKASLPRPELRGLVEGSLCLYKVEEASGDAAELLALLELVGMDELANICLNRVKILVEDPLPDVEGLLRAIEGVM